jgi:hypothetical protein
VYIFSTGTPVCVHMYTNQYLSTELLAPFRCIGGGGVQKHFGILYWKIPYSNFLQYKVPGPDRIRAGVLLPVVYLFL